MTVRRKPRRPLTQIACAAVLFVVAGPSAGIADAKPPVCDAKILFKGGTGGYHSYRIPSIVRTTRGTLIAFAEGRRRSAADYGDIDIVMRRSRDHGRTWGRVRLVFSKHGDTCGNPTAVVDQDTGAIWLFASWNAATHAQGGRGGLRPIDRWGQRRVYTARPHRLLFLNPASTIRRIRPHVRVSYDGGRTWAFSRRLPVTQGGYSSMAKTANYRVAALVEAGKNASGGHSIRLFTFNLPWLLNGRAEPKSP